MIVLYRLVNNAETWTVSHEENIEYRDHLHSNV
jgi:hypothetical protein